MQTRSTINIIFRVYTEAPGSHIVICQNHPEITFTCSNMDNCIKVAKEKIEYYIKNNNSFFNSGNTLSLNSKAEAGQFMLVYDLNDYKCIKVELAEKV